MMWSEALIASSVWGQENHGGSGPRQRNREGIREERWLGEVAMVAEEKVLVCRNTLVENRVSS